MFRRVLRLSAAAPRRRPRRPGVPRPVDHRPAMGRCCGASPQQQSPPHPATPEGPHHGPDRLPHPAARGIGIVSHYDRMSDEDVRSAVKRPARSGPEGAIRRAHLEDVDEVIRLAALMYEAMGIDASGGTWRKMAADQLRRRLGLDVMVFVVDDPTFPGRLAAVGAGSIAARLPGPGNPSAQAGRLHADCRSVVR